MRLFVLVVALLLSRFGFAAVTITDQPINFGLVPFTTPPGLAGQGQVPVTLIVNCTSGQSLKIEPNAGSNGYLTVNMTREGSANGTQYVYFFNGTSLMKSSVPGSLVNTTCTGTNQTFNLTAVISGTSQVGTAVALNRTEVISFSGKFFKVTVGGVVNYSSNQSISGSVVASCSPSIGNLTLGIIPAQGVSNTQQVTTFFRVTCDNGVPYTVAADSDASTWIYNSGLCADLYSPPQPANPALVCMKIKPSGAGNFQNLGVTNNLYSNIGTGTEQGYEIQANVTIPANTAGTLHKIINLKITF